MMKKILFSIMLVVLVGCKSPQFTAKTKTELAKLCLAEFPFDSTPIETKIDTTYIKVKEFIEVDCDSIGKKKVEHECEVKTVTKTKVVQDSRQTYLIQNLEGKLELEELHRKQLETTYRDNLSNKDNQHKEEIKSLKTKHSNEIDATRKERNKWRLIAIIGGVAFVVLKRFKII